MPNAPKPSPEEKPYPQLKQDFKPVMQICDNEMDLPLRETQHQYTDDQCDLNTRQAVEQLN